MRSSFEVTVDCREGVQAWVVVDSLGSGQAMGGIRMTEHVSLPEVAALARKMTLKLRLAGITMGGAKAGIRIRPDSPEVRRACLHAFGAAVAPLMRGGIYLGSDQGVSYDDRQVVHDAAGFDIGVTAAGLALRGSWSVLWQRCRDVTGFGVGEAADLACDFIGLPKPRRAVIQGFGTVGQGAAAFLAARGYRICAVADERGTVQLQGSQPEIVELARQTDAHGLMARRFRSPPSPATPTDAWLDVDADVLLLCANSGALNAENASRVRAKVVVEGANMPCTAAAHETLERRGVLVIPDIVANSGAAIVTAMVLQGQFPKSASFEHQTDWLFKEACARIRKNVERVLGTAAQTRTSPVHAGAHLALQGGP